MEHKSKDTYRVQITGYSHDGSGVGRIEKQVVFIPGALRGEEVLIRITRRQKGILWGESLRILQPSEERAHPLCTDFASCGGCQLQHMNYPEQLRFKEQAVRDAIKRIGGLSEDIPVHPVLGMAHPWSYRNKGVFQAARKGDRLALGFYEEGTHYLATRSCRDLFTSSVSELVSYLEELLNTRGIRAAEKNHPGLHSILVRESFASGDILLSLSVSQGCEGLDYGIAREICLNHPKVVGVCQNNKVIYGRGEIEDSIGFFSFTISAPSFFQVNTQQARVLYEKAVEYAGLSSGQLVVDAYSGIGTISLFLAQRAGRVLGIEAVPEAVRDARFNAGKNGVDNVEFIEGETEKILPELVRQGIKPDVVVVDPPRAGCAKEFLEALIQVGPARIVYVSCNPSTLARDLKILTTGGFDVIEVQPVDMFPQTYHTETCCLLVKV